MKRAAVDRFVFVGVIALGVGLGALGGSSLVARASAPPRVGAATAPPLVLHVPRVAAPFTIDGELDEPAWASAARTGGFTRRGAPARPYSDARLAWHDGALYLALYAADQDIRTVGTAHDEPLVGGDAFELVFTTRDGEERVLDVSATGVLTDGTRARKGALDLGWESHAAVAVDRDGTANDPSDEDEEWVVEMAIPLAALDLRGAGGEIGLAIRRCDVVGGKRVCATWPETAESRVVLDP